MEYTVHLIEPIEGIKVIVKIAAETYQAAQQAALTAVKKVWPTVMLAKEK